MSRLSLIVVARAPPINLNRADPLRASLRSVGWHGKLQKNAISAPSRLRLISQPVRHQNLGQFMEFVIAVLFGYLIIGTILTAPIAWFGRKRIIYKKHDLIIGVLPLIIYIGIHHIGPSKGGGANFVTESLLMSLLIPTAAALLLIVKSDYQQSMTNAVFLILAVGLAFGLRIFFPAMQD